MNTIHPDDIAHIKHLVERKNKGLLVNSQEVTDLYNKILEKSVSNTTCSSCVRRRIQELQDHLEKYEKECLTKLIDTIEEVFEEVKDDDKDEIREQKNKRGRKRVSKKENDV